MKTQLLLALHFHQPVGNFDHVFEEAVRRSYEPLVSHFERHPGVRAGFHLSGCLLEWLEQHDPRLLDRVTALIGRGQVEPLGGGFYEPILSVFPKEDGVEQLERLAAYWQKRASVRPVGAWLPERVWEQGLCEMLAAAGVRYTVLDDQHLRFAGLLDERFSGAFATERAGSRVAFFPSDFQLRYLIPFRTIDTVRAHFEQLAQAGNPWALTYGDDAEKFGLWPGTHKWVYEEKWLEQFFTLLEEERAPVATQLPGNYLANNPPRQKVYIPNASYTEMLEWALYPKSAAEYARVREAAGKGAHTESVRAFVRGSLWDAFLARYPEADQLHKHTLWTSRRTLCGTPEIAPQARERARTAALRAQCNCAYWHGLFGGVYLPHLRHGVYAAALEADALLAECLEGVAVECVDFDGDGREEVIVRSRQVQGFFKPGDAGTLAELDYLPARFNVTNTISRWKEAYHEGADIVHAGADDAAVASPHEKNVGLSAEQLGRLHFDALPLRSLREFRCTKIPSPEGLAGFTGIEPAREPLGDWKALPEGFEGTVSIGALRHRKQVALSPSGALRVRYESGSETGDGHFGVLLYFSLLAADASDRHLLLQSERGEETGAPARVLSAEQATGLRFIDEAFGFALDIRPAGAAILRATPVETLQRTEKDYETLYQGTLVALLWPAAALKDGITVSLQFTNLKEER